jgi:hypothetical protein
MDPVHDVDNAIRLAAYFKWEEAGRPCGDGVQFWLEAEREFRAAELPAEFGEIDIVEETSLESFPASDAPEWAGQTLRLDSAAPPAAQKPPTPARSTKKRTSNRKK